MQKTLPLLRENKRRTLFFVLVIIGALCCGMIYVYSYSLNDHDPYAYPKNGLMDFQPENVGYYKINPATTLASLERRHTDVFVPELTTSSAPVFNAPISWHQSDYLKITNAVFQSAWKETFDSWSLLSMIFETTCRNDPDGFESADIHFFKADGESDYTTREVIITPQYGNIAWGGGGLGSGFPRPRSGWKSIDLSRLKVTADDALRMAEDNGGKSFRLGADNKCSIGMILNMDAYDGWRVDYQGYDSLSIFVIQIDPYTGKVVSSRTFIPTSKPTFGRGNN